MQMNLQLHLVVSDITGVTGLSILKRILEGERDPLVLAALRDGRCKRSEAEIAEALRGTWREEHLFALRQSLATFEHLERQIGEVDQQIHQALATLDNDRECTAPYKIVPRGTRHSTPVKRQYF
jgi:hypothetical protein